MGIWAERLFAGLFILTALAVTPMAQSSSCGMARIFVTPVTAFKAFLVRFIIDIVSEVCSNKQFQDAIGKITQDRMGDERMLEGIRDIVQNSLADGNMYRAAGRGL